MDPLRSEVLQGTLDLMVLKALDAVGPMHGYGIASPHFSGLSCRTRPMTAAICSQLAVSRAS